MKEKKEKYYKVSIAKYGRKANMVAHKTITSFNDLDRVDEFIANNINRSLYVWCDGFANTSMGYLPGIFWTDNYLKELKKVIVWK